MGPGVLRVRACMCVHTCVCVRMPVSLLCTCAHIHEWPHMVLHVCMHCVHLYMCAYVWRYGRASMHPMGENALVL